MERAKQGKDGRAAQAALRTLDILEFFERQAGPATAEAIAGACGIPRSSLYNLLRMLRARGYVTYSAADRGWLRGPRLREPQSEGCRFADGLAVAEAVAAAPAGLCVDEVAVRCALSGDAAARILAALQESGLVVAGSDGTFVVGPRLVAHESPFGWTQRLQALARPILVRLRDAAGETASLVVQDGKDALYLDQVESVYELRCGGWTGRRVSGAGTSAGAAFRDPSRPHRVADAVEPGVTAITCAVPGIKPAVGVNVIGPTWRVNERGVEELTTLVQAAAGELGAAYAASSTAR